MEKSKKLKWEKDFSHNWNILKNPSLLTQMEKLTLASTEENDNFDIQTTKHIKPVLSNKINFNFNFLRNLVIILDLSESSNKVDLNDFKPNRHTFLLNKIEKFVSEYFMYNIASSIIILGNRNYSTEMISPYCQDEKKIIENIRKTNLLPQGSFSITNSLRAAMEFISSNSQMSNDILICITSNNTFDRDNVYEIVYKLNALNVRINILTLGHPLNIFKDICDLTKGDFEHVENEEAFDEFIKNVIYIKTKIEKIKLILAEWKCYNEQKLLCSCHNKLRNNVYVCSLCKEYYCKLPAYCRHCQGLIVNMTIVYQLKQGGWSGNLISKTECIPYKLNYYFEKYNTDKNFIDFFERFNVRLEQMHKKEYNKATKTTSTSYIQCSLSYKIKMMLVYIKSLKNLIYNNIIKNFSSEIEEQLIQETKVFLLKDVIKCFGCGEQLESEKEEELKRIFIFSNCLDIFCEECYEFLKENEIGCVSC